jgi:SAGA-associated factor 11
MGMGRNSSRIASKRIANTSVKNNDSDGEDYDNNADTDWSLYCNDSKKTRRKKDKNSNGNNITLNNVQKKVNNSKNNNKLGLISKKSFKVSTGSQLLVGIQRISTIALIIT